MLEQQVREALSQVIDPETGLNIMRMELIRDIRVEANGSVELVFRPSSPQCPMAYALANSVKKKVESLESITSLHITVENFVSASHLEGLLNTPRSGNS